MLVLRRFKYLLRAVQFIFFVIYLFISTISHFLVQLEKKIYFSNVHYTGFLQNYICKSIYSDESIVNSNPTQEKMCAINDRRYEILYIFFSNGRIPNYIFSVLIIIEINQMLPSSIEQILNSIHFLKVI